MADEPRKYYQWTGFWEYQNQSGDLYLRARIGELTIYLFQNKGSRHPKAPQWQCKFSIPVDQVVLPEYTNQPTRSQIATEPKKETPPDRQPGDDTPF